MPTTFANTINGNPLYAARAVADSSGNDIQATYATKSEVTTDLSTKQDVISDLATIRSGAASGSTAVQPGDLATVATSGSYTDLSNKPTIPSGTQLVPAATTADADKVLTVDSLGVPGWAVIPEQPTGLFQATYGTSTYNEVRDAVSANKIVYCSVSGRMAFLAFVSSDFCEFQYYRSNSSSLGTDSVFVYQVRQSGWETTERTVKAGNIRYPVTQVNVNGASAMTGTVANITIPAAPTVDQTFDATSANAQSGVAVAGALATKQDTISDLATIRSGAAAGATAVQPGDLAAVARTGDYTDLYNTPSIPTATSDLTNDSGFITLSDVPAQVQTDWDATSGLGEILHKPDLSIYAESADLSTVATTGSYDDLLDKPVIPAAQVNSDWNASSGVAEILNKPQLSTVATTGDYDDLVNKPSIPAAQVNSDWNAASGVAQILNKPDLSVYATNTALTNGLATKQDTISDLSTIRSGAALGATSVQPGDLATVATTGSYDDLADKPDLSVYAESSDLATVATTGSYTDLSNTPSIPTATSDLTNDSGFITLSDVPAQVNADWNSSSGASEILHKPDLSIYAQSSSLATVATTGDYDDLTNKPTIPAAQVNADWNAASGVAQILNKPTIPAALSAGNGIDITSNVVSAKVDGTTVTTNASGELVSPTEVFIATYGTTTYAEIDAAYTAGKSVFMKRTSSSNEFIYPLCEKGGSLGTDYYKFSANPPGALSDGRCRWLVYIIWATNSWSTSEKGALKYPSSSADNGKVLTAYYNSASDNGVKWTTPGSSTVDQTYDGTSTNAQSGTAVAQAIATKEDAFDVGTGLEMDTSGATPTLQVEAPVDIVAGTGIAIDNPDGNTMRITNTGFPVSTTDAVRCGTFNGNPMYMKNYTFTGTVGNSETTINMSIDEKLGTGGINRIWIDMSNSFVLYGSSGNIFMPLSWRLGSARGGGVSVINARAGSLTCRCIDTSATPLTFSITIRYTVTNA